MHKWLDRSLQEQHNLDERELPRGDHKQEVLLLGLAGVEVEQLLVVVEVRPLLLVVGVGEWLLEVGVDLLL